MIQILIKDLLLTMTLCAPNEAQDKGNLGQKDFQIIRKSTLVPQRIMVSYGSLKAKRLKFFFGDFFASQKL